MPPSRFAARVPLSVVSTLAVFLAAALFVLWPQPLSGQQTNGAKSNSRKHPKLSTPLAALARSIPQQRGAIAQGERIAPPPDFSVNKLPKLVRDAARAGLMRINKEVEVQVYIRLAEVTAENLRELQAAGVKVELHEKRQRIVQARVPVSRLEEVAALSLVQSIRLPDYSLRNTGSVDTEADSILKTDQVRSLLGVDGTGVRVGIISDGVRGIFATSCAPCDGVVGRPISTDDLPVATGTRGGNGILTSVSGGLTARSFRTDEDLEGDPGPDCASPSPGAGAEGTAILEIVHDLAPGAQLFFSNFDTSLEFTQAVNFLAANTDVVVDDIGCLTPPFDGTSFVSTSTANALKNNSNPIRAYLTSAGNFARNHYQESFVDSGVDGISATGLPGMLHLFQPTANTSDILGFGPVANDPLFLPAGATVNVILVWDDSLGASANDYDLFLMRDSTETVVVGSENFQTGTQDPVERFSYTNDTGSDDFFRILIQNFADLASVRSLEMFIFQSSCDASGPVSLGPSREKHNYNTIGSSVLAQSDAGGSPVSVISVGAIDQGDPINDDIEFFSARGPTNDGRLTPDVTRIDGVSITGAEDFGAFPSGTFPQGFFGTSAAAPHAAGVGALLLQSAPCLVEGAGGALSVVDARTALRNLILNNAVDLGTPGPDNVFGHGRIDALASANQTIPTASAGPNQTISGTGPSGASVNLDGSGSVDPSGCPLAFDWIGDCGIATGATPQVGCAFGTNDITLTVTNNGAPLSSPASVQITVTDFTVAASPATATMSGGQAALYTVALDPQFGSFNNSVSLTCSHLPLSASCNFSPTLLTPGSSGATSQLSISTTASSFSPPPPFGPQNQGLFYAVWLALAGIVLFRQAFVNRLPVFKNLSAFFLISLLFLFLGFHAACGDGGGGGQLTMLPGTPSGTFAITITGTSGSLQNSTTANLIVQ